MQVLFKQGSAMLRELRRLAEPVQNKSEAFRVLLESGEVGTDALTAEEFRIVMIADEMVSDPSIDNNLD